MIEEKPPSCTVALLKEFSQDHLVGEAIYKFTSLRNNCRRERTIEGEKKSIIFK